MGLHNRSTDSNSSETTSTVGVYVLTTFLFIFPHTRFHESHQAVLVPIRRRPSGGRPSKTVCINELPTFVTAPDKTTGISSFRGVLRFRRLGTVWPIRPISLFDREQFPIAVGATPT